MTVQEEHQLIGRMVQERKALRGRLTLLHEEAGRIGKELIHIGNKMEGRVAHQTELKPEQVDVLDAEKVMTVLNEIKEASTRLDELNEKLKDFD